MGLFLKQFSTHAEYDTYINGSDAILPNVSICTTEGDVHYNPWVEPQETRLVAKFNVTDTSNPTQIIGYNSSSPFSAIEIDGVVQSSVVSAYTFSTTGEHTVKYTLTSPTSLKNAVFNYCTSLTSVIIPDGVAYIGQSAFQNCSGLTSIDIPNSVTSIWNSAFKACKSLTSIDIPSSVTGIGDSVFFECKSLTSCTIGSGVTSIGADAFYYCIGLTSIDIPDKVANIGNSAFQNCVGLTSLTIGSSITSISTNAFENCRSVKNMTVEATAPPSLGSYAFRYISFEHIYVPCNSVDTYKAATDWSTYASRIQAIPGSCL